MYLHLWLNIHQSLSLLVFGMAVRGLYTYLSQVGSGARFVEPPASSLRVQLYFRDVET